MKKVIVLLALVSVLTAAMAGESSDSITEDHE